MELNFKTTPQQKQQPKQSAQRMHTSSQLVNLNPSDTPYDFRDLEHGPYVQAQRHCKDIFCFIFYWANTAAMVALSAWALFTGDPSNIYRSTDSLNNICGKAQTSAETYRYAYFFNPTNFENNKRVCVSECPYFKSGTLTDLKCLPSGPDCTVNVTVSSNGQATPTISDNGDFFIQYQSKERIDRICRPTDTVLQGALKPYSASIADSLIQQKLLDFISDVQNNYGWVIAMAGLAVALSILYLVGLKFIPSIMIWLSIIVSLVLFVLIGFVFLYNGGALTAQPQQGRLGIATSTDRFFYDIYGGFTLFFAVIITVILVCCFQQTFLTVQMTRIASKFLGDIPTMFGVTVGMTIGMSLFWTTSLSSMIYALSAAEYEARGGVFTSVHSKEDRGLIMLYYFIFNTLWTHQIFITTVVFCVASVTSKWYFISGPVSDLDKPVFKTLMMVMRYHYGSLVFGSLILLIVQFLQFFAEIIYFVHEWKYSKKNKCVKVLDSILQFICKFIHKITKRLNRFAYIQIGIRGKNFIDSSKDAFALIHYNPRRYGFLFGLDSIIYFLIRLSIALIPTTIFYLFASFAKFTEQSILEPIYFILIIFYICLGIASVIISTYSTAIDSILTCYIIDEINQKEKNGKPLYAFEQIEDLFVYLRN